MSSCRVSKKIEFHTEYDCKTTIILTLQWGWWCLLETTRKTLRYRIRYVGLFCKIENNVIILELNITVIKNNLSLNSFFGLVKMYDRAEGYWSLPNVGVVCYIRKERRLSLKPLTQKQIYIDHMQKAKLYWGRHL